MATQMCCFVGGLMAFYNVNTTGGVGPTGAGTGPFDVAGYITRYWQCKQFNSNCSWHYNSYSRSSSDYVWYDG
ncbi:MAG: hypothetical protein IPL04_14930 [Chitinophagaceae bacterium]|nr:hypothetical protein [Chitinophagaceae bacterium]